MDMSQIESALGLATTALGATGKAVTTIDAIRKLLKSDPKPDADKANELLNNLATELTAANMMNVQLSEALKGVSRAVKQQDDFEKERARYELVETSEGDVLFRLRSEAAAGQPGHFICPVCLNRDKIFSFVTGRGDYRHCQTDSNHVFTFSNTRQPRTSGDWYD